MENIKTKHDDIEKSVCFKKRKSLSEMSLEELWRAFSNIPHRASGLLEKLVS